MLLPWSYCNKLPRGVRQLTFILVAAEARCLQSWLGRQGPTPVSPRGGPPASSSLGVPCGASAHWCVALISASGLNVFLPLVSVSKFPSSSRDTSHWIRAHLLVPPLHLQTPSLPLRSNSQVWGWGLPVDLQGTQFNPSSCCRSWRLMLDWVLKGRVWDQGFSLRLTIHFSLWFQNMFWSV